MDIKRIKELNELLEDGLITQAEFDRERAKAAQQNASSADSEQNNYAVFKHLSQLLGWLVPLLGFIVPIVMWQSRKDDPLIDAQGRCIANWLLSTVVYWLICMVLTLILVGFFALTLLAIVGIIFAILGAINASNGKVWAYPLSIRFFRPK